MLRSAERNLFVHREKRLHRPVGYLPAVQDGQGQGHADAVVGAQRGACGTEPLAVDDGLYRVFQEIMLHVLALLGHHVRMPLQHDARSALLARRGGLADERIAALVGLVPEAPLLGKAGQIFFHALLVTGRTGDVADFLEETEHILRL